MDEGDAMVEATQPDEVRERSHTGEQAGVPADAPVGGQTVSGEAPAALGVEVPSGLRESQAARFREIAAIIVRNELVKGLTPQKVRQTLEDLGPTYVKIGQIMSMRPDMIPKEYCREFQQLRSDVAPMSAEDVHLQLTSTYGVHLKDTFSEFDEEPIGSASIAQAHRAVLVGGEKVVLKIQRPGIYDMMSDDIAMLRRLAHALKPAMAAGPVDFERMLDEMWQVAQEEMDFLVEAHNNERFADFNRDDPRITCPKIYDSLTTSKILVMEYVDGISVGDVEHLDAAGYDRSELGAVLVSNYIKQVTEDGFFHADPHPGNVWVRDGRIVWIDMGMMGHLSTKERRCVNDAILAVVDHDVNALKEIVLTLGIYSGDINHPRLYGDIDTFLTKYGTLDMEGFNLGAAVAELMDLAMSNGIQMPASMSMFARGVATLEGTVSVLCPTLSLKDVMQGSVEKSLLDNFDLGDFVRDKARKLYSSSSKAVELPGLATDLLKMTLQGRTKVSMDIDITGDSKGIINDWVNRIVAGLVVSAFLIGSSFLCTTDMNPRILGVPALGVLGFLVALFLAAGVLFDSRRRKRR